MRFAFLILGPRFEPERDRAAILDGTAQIVGVPTVEQAARQAATHNQVPVGFVTHLPEQEELFRTTFGG